MNPGVIGGILGAVLGLVGGIIGSWMSIRNTNSPREKRFMIQVGIVWWIGIIIFLGLLFLLPQNWRWFMWIPYSILLPVAIITGNRKQNRIRREEQEKQETSPQPEEPAAQP
ncbi:MAG: hypothetical protein K8R90_03450 [Candidatus Cloacimonetes bacterium]|nr:hypothetical protein [Candidatus Cloacimonadota bacterium]